MTRRAQAEDVEVGDGATCLNCGDKGPRLHIADDAVAAAALAAGLGGSLEFTCTRCSRRWSWRIVRTAHGWSYHSPTEMREH